MTDRLNNLEFLLAPFLGWAIAQFIKIAINLRKDGIQWTDAIQSGGMPSSHTSFTMGLSTIIGINFGFDSVYFALAFALACVVMYDAMGVRRTTGEQTKAINALFIDSKLNRPKIHVSYGHSLAEVLAGVLVGVFSALASHTLV